MQATSDIRCEMRERERGPCGRPHRIWGIATGEIALCAFARGLEKRQRWAEQSANPPTTSTEDPPLCAL